MQRIERVKGRIHCRAIVWSVVVGGWLAGCERDPSAETTDVTLVGVDADGDGYSVPEDCDDNKRNIHPGAEEKCDGKDNDCDTLIDDADDAVVDQGEWYIDEDGDGFGTAAAVAAACEAPPGYAPQAGDCADDDDTKFPGAFEACDGIDNDCDSETDDAEVGFYPVGGAPYALEEGSGGPQVERLTVDGEVRFCTASTWQGALDVAANVDIVVDPSVMGTPTIDTDAGYPCIEVSASGVTVTVDGLRFTECDSLTNLAGGALACTAPATVVGSNLTFETARVNSGATAASVLDGCDLQLSDSLFLGDIEGDLSNDLPGGGLLISGATATLQAVTFQNVRDGALLINPAEYEVGADPAAVVCTGCVFDSNGAVIGAAAEVGPDATFEAIDSEFVSTDILGSGGAIVLGSFEDVMLGSPALVLERVFFERNFAGPFNGASSVVLTESGVVVGGEGITYNYENETVSVSCTIEGGCN